MAPIVTADAPGPRGPGLPAAPSFVLVRPRGPRARVLAGFTADQGDKARLVLNDGGLFPHSRPGFYWVVSSDGERVYLTCSRRCNCPAGIHDRRCYHQAAAALLDDARGEARRALNDAHRHWYRARKARTPDQRLRFLEMARAAAQLARRLDSSHRRAS